MTKHNITHGQHLPGCICCGRSSLARSDTASVAHEHNLPLRSFRSPLRKDCVRNTANGKKKLVNTSQWCTPLVHGRSILARSDIASNAITHSLLQRSMFMRPLSEDIVSRICKWRTKHVDTSQWRTPPLRNDALQYSCTNRLRRSLFK